MGRFRRKRIQPLWRDVGPRAIEAAPNILCNIDFPDTITTLLPYQNIAYPFRYKSGAPYAKYIGLDVFSQEPDSLMSSEHLLSETEVADYFQWTITYPNGQTKPVADTRAFHDATLNITTLGNAVNLFIAIYME